MALAAHTFYAIERRQSLYDPAYKLFRTHVYEVSNQAVDTGRDFPDRSEVVTFSTRVRKIGRNPNGVVFTFGADPVGFALWVAGDQVGVAVQGASNAVSYDGDDLRLVSVVVPSRGAVALYINGKLVIYEATSSQALPNGWASGDSGFVGHTSANIIQSVPAAQRVNLAGCDMSPLEGFLDQYPRQLDGRFPVISTNTPPPVNPPPSRQGGFSSGFSDGFDK